ncbi:hypothetical protein K431DRAFT_233948 [Polychaeton citri CBS 116435]|uniref:Cyclin n=1 Tax=Polychaeton citri CBS 116435 TaxID=1314669 RepID=A0A9P4UL82_9PEZI|nr:hypothetical protein K431DRAFT_233948 [Polychaeton citri CBS 116435]
MPAFYSQSMANQLPLTPPDSGSGYNYSSMHYTPYVAHQGQSRLDNAYDYPQGYMQAQAAPPQSTFQYPQPGFQTANRLPPISSYYEPIGAPTLPPLQIQERVPFSDDLQRRLHEQQSAVAREQQKQVVKEEKATGGVSAKLDYDMERMTDFVTDATQSMYGFHQSPICLADIDVTRSFQQNVHSQPSFRKWVHQVLSATRLPSATILLSLHYLNDRLTNMPHSVQRGDNQVYRLLAVALILGSKFLDDNTFINRSWSDVTAIKVTELNMLEMKWLSLIRYELHVDPTDPKGLPVWLDAWKKYDATQTAKQQQARLSPLNTNVHRQAKERYSPYPSPYSATQTRPAYDVSQSSRPSQYAQTPYMPDAWSAGERSSTAGDFYKRDQRYPSFHELDDASRRASEERARHANAYPYASSVPYYPQSAYAPVWDQGAWSGVHRYDCGCSPCNYNHYRNYPMAANYAAQTVIG